MKSKKLTAVTKKISDCIDELTFIECETNPLINKELQNIKYYRKRVKTLDNGNLKDNLENQIKESREKWLKLKEREKEIRQVLMSAIESGIELTEPKINYEDMENIFTT